MQPQSPFTRKEIIKVPFTVKVEMDKASLWFKGPLGSIRFDPYKHDEKGLYALSVSTVQDSVQTIILSTKQSCDHVYVQGIRALFTMYMEGVTRGYVMHLECVGVGYKAQIVDGVLIFRLGFSHTIRCAIPPDLRMFIPKPTRVSVYGIDKTRVTQIVMQLRSIKPPEPYKGKGIRLKNEVVRRKEGKKK
jgi:large subunit ribosomal protein L6